MVRGAGFGAKGYLTTPAIRRDLRLLFSSFSRRLEALAIMRRIMATVTLRSTFGFEFCNLNSDQKALTSESDSSFGLGARCIR